MLAAGREIVGALPPDEVGQAVLAAGGGEHRAPCPTLQRRAPTALPLLDQVFTTHAARPLDPCWRRDARGDRTPAE
jgi:hypothetical protein